MDTTTHRDPLTLESSVHRITSRAVALAATAALVSGSLTLAAGIAPIGAEVLCSTQQVTGIGNPNDEVTATQVEWSSDGGRAVVASPSDILGGNPDGNLELWTVDMATGAFDELTSTLGGGSFTPALDRDGSRVAFVSDRDLAVGENADGSQEVFLYDLDTEAFTQITDVATLGFSMLQPSISGDGTHVAFSTDADVDGTNSDASLELFVHTVGGATAALTTQPAGVHSTSPSFSDDGSRLAFVSTADIGGGNADGNQEVYLHTLNPGATTQITDTTGAVSGDGHPALNTDGTVLAFTSDRDLDPGANDDGNIEAFVHTVGTTTFRQITSTVENAVGAPQLSGDGGRVVYGASSDPLGTNADESGELWLQPLDEQLPVQLTDTADDENLAVSIGLAGTPVFASSADPVGFNPNHELRLFRSICSSPAQTFTDVGPTHPFFDEISWMDAAGISTGFQPGPTYRPSASVSRQAMSAFMYRVAGSPAFSAPGSPTFGDVSTTHPFYDEIEWMASEDITTGTPASPKPLYKPSAAVSRSAMSAFMYRLAGSPPFVDPAVATFGDVTATNPRFTEIEWMASEDITTGTPASPKPLYKPSAAVSRGAMSAFLFRLIDGPGVDVFD